MTLARFYADPKRVKIAVRHNGLRARITIACKCNLCEFPWQMTTVTNFNQKSIETAMRCLLAEVDYPGRGIDTGLQWSYDHPMHRRRTGEEREKYQPFTKEDVTDGGETEK